MSHAKSPLKRVTLDATPLLFPHGGVGRVTGALLRAMAPHAEAAGIQLQLVARALKGPSIRTLQPDFPGTHLRLPVAGEGIMRALKLVQRLSPAELYHATDHVMPIANPERAIATVHDLIFLLRPEAHMPIHLRQQETVPPFVQAARGIIACSEHTKRDLVQHLNIDPERIDVIYWGIDRELFSPTDSPEAAREALERDLRIVRPYFFSVSCSTGRKNTPRLLDAYEKLLKDSPSHDLVLAWTPPFELIDRHRDSINAGRIRFLSRVDDSVLRRLYQCATAVVYPSLYEGFGLPVLEAFATGVPVITSSASSLPEVGGDAAIYIDPDSTDSICDALAAFENGAVDREARIAAGQAQVAKFSWDACAQSTLNVYRRYLGL